MSALRTGLLYPPGNIPGTHFYYRLSQPQGHSAAGRIVSMQNSSDIIGNRTRVVPRIFATNILRYLLHFAPESKSFELKRLVIFVFVYRTQLSHSINSTSAVLCLVLRGCQKCCEAKYVLRTKHDGKHYSVPTLTPSFLQCWYLADQNAWDVEKKYKEIIRVM